MCLQHVKAVPLKCVAALSSFWYSLTIREISGSCGDLGVFIPLVVGMVKTNGLDLGTTLIFTGAYNIITGAAFGIPMPVQPMKTIAAVALSEVPLTVPQIMAAGMFVSTSVLLLGVTGLMGLAQSLIPMAVVRGLQLGVGLVLATKGFLQVWYLDSHAAAPRGWWGVEGLLLGLFSLSFLLLTVYSKRDSTASPPAPLLPTSSSPHSTTEDTSPPATSPSGWQHKQQAAQQAQQQQQQQQALAIQPSAPNVHLGTGDLPLSPFQAATSAHAELRAASAMVESCDEGACLLQEGEPGGLSAEGEGVEGVEGNSIQTVYFEAGSGEKGGEGGEQGFASKKSWTFTGRALMGGITCELGRSVGGWAADSQPPQTAAGAAAARCSGGGGGARQGNRWEFQIPSALVITLVGLLIALISQPQIWRSLSFGPSLPHFTIPSASDWRTGILRAGLPQLSLTTFNSVISVCQLSRELFPQRPASPNAVAASVGAMNLVGGWWGALPACHGAGGLAAQARFGATSGAAPFFLGMAKLGLGLLFGSSLFQLLQAFPQTLMGSMLVYAGIELAACARSQRGERGVAVMLLTAAVSLALSNVAAGVAAGLIASYLLLASDLVRKWLGRRWRRTP